MPYREIPYLGFGLGLRAKHYPYIFENKPKIDWFEIISENFMDTDGRAKTNLARIKEIYPVVMHGVSMSIGTIDPLNSEYLQKLKKLIKWLNPAWISDHLCWTGIAHKNTHDLLPVPYTEEALTHIIKRIKEVQDYLEMPIALENPSTYLEFTSSTMLEAEFVSQMTKESGCNLLLDVNNIYVTCYNHHLDPKKYIDTLPLDKVMQIHLSGHSNKGHYIIDTHDDHVIDDVWNLYKYVVHKSGRIPNTMIEWDDNIPEFADLFAELEKAKIQAKTPSNYVIPVISVKEKQISEQKANVKSLQYLQNLMQDSIIKGEDFNSKPEEWIVSKKEFLPQEQLSVYINAYRYRLNDITSEDYPVLEKYLGKEVFDELIWDFVNEVVPDHFNIARYTLKLPKFIANKYPSDIFAKELCELETAIAQLHDPDETKPLTQEHLTGMTTEMLMDSFLYPRKALKLFAFNYSVNDYYGKAMKSNIMDHDEILPQNSYLVIFRHEDKVWRMDLEKEEHDLLSKLFSKITIGKALAELDDSYMDKVFVWFSRWINNGLLSSHNYVDVGINNNK